MSANWSRQMSKWRPLESIRHPVNVKQDEDK